MVSAQTFHQIMVSAQTFHVSILDKMILRPKLGMAMGQKPQRQTIQRGEPFSPFIKSHRKTALRLANLLKEKRRSSELRDFCIGIRDHINENLFIYALTFVILHKKEYRKMFIPCMVEVFPHKFIPHQELMRLNDEIIHNDELQPVILHWGLALSCRCGEPEHRVAYWREDFGVNCHYWHWLVANPVYHESETDRKGELFYYMHQQMLARYDCERLSMGLARVEPLDPRTWKKPIREGYFPYLAISGNGKMYGSRQNNTVLSDVYRRDYEEVVDILKMTMWAKRLQEMVETLPISKNDAKDGQVQSKWSYLCRLETLDFIADAICHEQEGLCNISYWGWLNLAGHAVLAYAHDPVNNHDATLPPCGTNYKAEMGVMGDPFTAARDPLFYRWYKFIDNLFQTYNLRKHPYTVDELEFPGVVLQEVNLTRVDDRLGEISDDLETGWSIKEFDLARGIDFNTPCPVRLLHSHLDRKPFKYDMTIHNLNNKSKMGTVRIFIAPKYNAQGEEMAFDEQRGLWIEMDKFTVPLLSGVNFVSRSSEESSVIGNRSFSFRDIEEGIPNKKCFDYDSYSGCGWPRHLQIPRGDSDGMTFLLFVMVTDWEVDSAVHDGDSAAKSNSEISQESEANPVKMEDDKPFKQDDVLKDEKEIEEDSKCRERKSSDECEVDADSDEHIIKEQTRNMVNEDLAAEDRKSLKRKDRRQRNKVRIKKNKNLKLEEVEELRKHKWKRTDCNNDGASYCGLRDSKYPDRRPMGFPFDRRPTLSIYNQPVESYSDYIILDNIVTQDFTITYRNHRISSVDYFN